MLYQSKTVNRLRRHFFQELQFIKSELAIEGNRVVGYRKADGHIEVFYTSTPDPDLIT